MPLAGPRVRSQEQLDPAHDAEHPKVIVTAGPESAGLSGQQSRWPRGTDVAFDGSACCSAYPETPIELRSLSKRLRVDVATVLELATR